MTDSGSVTLWLQQIQSNHADKAQAGEKIWQRYVAQLIRVAHAQLATGQNRAADAEDIVQEAFSAFFQAAEEGRLPGLKDRNNLWPLLVKITENKAHDARKHQSRQKRGSGQVRGDSVFGAATGLGFQLVPSTELDPQMAVGTVDSLRQLLADLDPASAKIALLRLEGHSNAEIAKLLDCAPETISRKLVRIRRSWELHFGAAVDPQS